MNIESATPRDSNPIGSCVSFARALSIGDLDQAATWFARDACLITPDTTAVHGRERIRPVLAQMVTRRTEIRVELSTAVGSGEVILARQRWRVRAGAPDARIEQTLNAILVLRQIEGIWKLSIAAPWGYGRTYG
ncbi:MAG TPA: nuclear transport factor 2 family protein [Solirubrobacterales bacterium]|nr:nuclear transport factor 2 family protein [Solirubrobacterales bacterium]